MPHATQAYSEVQDNESRQLTAIVVDLNLATLPTLNSRGRRHTVRCDRTSRNEQQSTDDDSRCPRRRNHHNDLTYHYDYNREHCRPNWAIPTARDSRGERNELHQCHHYKHLAPGHTSGPTRSEHDHHCDDDDYHSARCRRDHRPDCGSGRDDDHCECERGWERRGQLQPWDCRWRCRGHQRQPRRPANVHYLAFDFATVSGTYTLGR